MDTQVEAAPPNIMFVFDNSGSMDWEFMTSESDGLFQGERYVFDNPGDNVYSNDYILSGSNRAKWKSQWFGYNRMYYNPNVTYTHWPLLEDANPDNPRSNPINASPTLDLSNAYYTIQIANNAVVIDNNTAGFSKDEDGPASWISYTHANAFNGQYYYSGGNGDIWARWDATLPAPGTYEVYVWWRSSSGRSNNVQYNIVHQGVTDTTYRDQNINDDQWNSLGTFTFNDDGTEYVELVGVASGNDFCADAVMYTTGISSLQINNAHYYALDDANGNGVADSGETKYLINFEDSDSDGSIDTRTYYEFIDENGNDMVDSDELGSVATLPDNVKSSVFDEEGNFVRFKTDEEELQNFANWYSFYRRRELAAKAAVGFAINGIDRMNVGYYTINSGVRDAVMGINIETNSIVFDNNDGSFSTVGSWGESGSPNEYKNSSKYTSGTGSSATWTPNITETGEYNVYGWWNCYSNRDKLARYTIVHDAGSTNVTANQRDESGNVCGDWVSLGTYNFTAGTGSVTVTRMGDGGDYGSSTNADAIKFEPTSGGITVDNTSSLLNTLYSINSSGSTPLRTALENVGRYFHQDDGSTGNVGDSPYASAADGGACQHAFAIAMTDGYWNGSDPSVGNEDSSEGSPYADIYSATLADVAMKYYKTDLSAGLENIVPTNSCDPADHQHMVTYSVSFGVSGTLTPVDADGDGEEDDPCFLKPSTPAPAWPNPTSGDPQKIDDLWHSAVNGHGLFFSANNPEVLVNSLISLLQNIESRNASGASVSVNGEELNAGTVLYQSSYLTDSWTGSVTAYPVDPSSGEIKREEDDILWDAQDELQKVSWNDRKILTYNGTSAGTPFRYGSLTSSQQAALDLDPAVAQNVCEYLRGRTDVPGFRYRNKTLGDIVHSAPILQGDTVYAGGNDGMLHAFDANTGRERFAYVPNLVFSNLASLTKPTYTHKYFVDLTPYTARNVAAGGGAITMLVGGLAGGGKGYYALDITDADTIEATATEDGIKNMVMWEYPKAGVIDADLGYSFSKAFIVRSYASSGWIVMFGNGYNSLNGNAVLYALDPSDGSLIATIDTGVGVGNGLSTPIIIDTDNDYRADFVYAGDLKGNLWKFDIRDANPGNWKVSNSDGVNPKPLFQATGQSITTKPDVMAHCAENGYIVVFGTGKYFGESDRSSTDIQTIYGIWDRNFENSKSSPGSSYIGKLLDRDTGQLSNPDNLEEADPAGNYLLIQGLRKDGWDAVNNYGYASENRVNWDNVTMGNDGTDNDSDGDVDENDEQRHLGWYFDLGESGGQRIIKDPVIRNGNVIVLSFIPNSSPCSGGGNSRLYELDACSGSRPDDPPLRVDDPNVEPPDIIEKSGLLHEPVIITMPDGEREVKIFSTSSGGTTTVFEDAEKRGMFFWKEW